MREIKGAFLGAFTFGNIDPESGDTTVFHASIFDEEPRPIIQALFERTFGLSIVPKPFRHPLRFAAPRRVVHSSFGKCMEQYILETDARNHAIGTVGMNTAVNFAIGGI